MSSVNSPSSSFISNEEEAAAVVTLSPPPKPPRFSFSSDHSSITSTKKIPPPIPPKLISRDCTPHRNSTSSSDDATELVDVDPRAARSATVSPPTTHDRRASILSNNSIEGYYQELKNFGRQVKRQILEDEDIMAIGNKITTAIPPHATRRSRAISMESDGVINLDEIIGRQQEQLLSSFSKIKNKSTATAQSNDRLISLPEKTTSADKQQQMKEAEKEEQVKSVVDSVAPSPTETEAKEAQSSIIKLQPASVTVQPANITPTVTEFDSNAIELAPEKRNFDFHALFRSVPETDNLIEEYNCAMFKDILIQGKLYISQCHLCFNAKFFSWVTNLVIAFEDIVSIEKKMMAMIVPNGIQVTTSLGSKHIFASFMTRDTTFDQIYSCWKTYQLSVHQKEEILMMEPTDDGDVMDLENLVTQAEETATVDAEEQDVLEEEGIAVIDKSLFGTVEGIHKLLFDSDFMYHYLIDIEDCQGVNIGTWNDHDKSRNSTFKKNQDFFQVSDKEICNQADKSICVQTTMTKKGSSSSYQVKTCITRKSNRQIKLLILIDSKQEQYDHHFIHQFEKILCSNSTIIQELSEGRSLTTCWQRPHKIQKEYIEPTVKIFLQAKRVLILSLCIACDHIQTVKKEHLFIFVLFLANLFTILHSIQMSQRMNQLEKQQNQQPDVLDLHPATNITPPIEMNHLLFMQQKMDEIKNKISNLRMDISLQKEQISKNG